MSTLSLVRTFVLLGCVSAAAVVQGAPPNPPPLPSVKDPPAPLKPPDDPILPTNVASAYLPGSGSVAPTGDYSYSIPLMLPRGRNGMQPTLSLDYSSRRRDQLLGVGWSVGGLSVVHRCNRTVAVDGIADGVDLEGDALCLDGQKLVDIGSGEYRTERESFRRIQGSIEGMTVRHKDGSIATYEPRGDTLPITSVKDVAGNEIRYHYRDDASQNIGWIEYTTRVGDASPGPYRVDFDYKQRGIPLEAYAGDARRIQDNALDVIRVSGPNGDAWKYTLGYERSPATTQLRLATVQLCSYGTCTQKRQFEYADEKPEWETKVEFSYDKYVDEHNVHVLDIDGDGRDDVLIGHHGYWRSQFFGSTDGEPIPGVVQDNYAFSDDYFTHADIDRDGKSEIIAYDPNQVRWRFYRFDGSQFVEDNNFPLLQLYSGLLLADPQKEQEREKPHFVDLDGDGLPEMIRAYYYEVGQLHDIADPKVRVYDNVAGMLGPLSDHSLTFFPPGNSFENPAPYPFENYPVQVPAWAQDFWGQGRQALIRRTFPGFEGGGHAVLYRNDQGQLKSASISSGGFPDVMVDADVNGDGLRDRIQPHEDVDPEKNVFVYANLNTGAELGSIAMYGEQTRVHMQGGFPHSSTTRWLVGDLNGDNREEIVTYPDSTARRPPHLRVFTPVEELAPADEPQGWDGDPAVLVVPEPDEPVRRRLKAYTIPTGWNAPDGQSTGFRLITARMGDFDGDGLADFVVAANRCTETGDETMPTCNSYLQDEVFFRVLTRKNTQADYLVSVKDEGAERLREYVVWKQWSSPDGWQDSCSYPDECLRHGFPVVAEHRTLDPSTNGEAESGFYSYYGPRSDIRGRGFLGFQQVVAWFPQRPMEIVTNYLPYISEGGVYPYAALPGSVRTTVPILESPILGRTDAEKPSTAQARVTLVATDYAWTTSAGTANWSFPTHSYTAEWEEEVSIDWHDEAPMHITGMVQIPETPLRVVQTYYEFDAIGNPKKITNATQGGSVAQTEKVYSYDPAKWPMALVEANYERSARSSTSAFKTRTTEYDYDTNGQLTDVRIEPGGGAMFQHTKLTRDPVTGLVTMRSDFAQNQDARHTAMVWDDTGAHILSQTDALGNATWRTVWPELGVTTAFMDPNGAQTISQYDGLGRVRSRTTDGGSSTVHGRQLESSATGLRGLIEGVSSNTGAESYSVLDEAGRIKESCSRAFGDGEYKCSYAVYDVNGNIWKSTRPGPADGIGGPATYTHHDSLGRPLDSNPPAGESAKWIHTFYETEMIEPNGNHHRSKRDVDGHIVLTTDYEDKAGTKAVETQFEYVEFGELHKVIDAKGNTVTQYHDFRGRRTGLSDPDMGLRTFAYNGFDELTRVSFPDGSKRELEYDVAGRMRKIVDRNSVNAVTGTTEWIWDSANNGQGQLAKTISSDGYTETSYQYDSFGRATKHVWKIGAESFSFSTSYDGYGRPKAVVYPTVGALPEISVVTSYDDYGHLQKTQARFVHTLAQQGMPPLIEMKNVWEVVSRSADGSLTNAKLGNGVEGKMLDDVLGRNRWIQWTAADASIDLHHEYDDSGNLVGRKDDAIQRIEGFDYDGLNRMTRSTLNYASGQVPFQYTDYEYDALGNTKKVYQLGVLSEDNAYGALSKPHALDNDGFGTSFQYDVRGRLKNDGTRTYVYTPFDKPSSVTQGAKTWQYRYDASQNRVVAGDGTTTTLNIDKLYERRSSAAGTIHVFRVPGSEGIAAEIQYDKSARSIRYFSGDRLGSVSMVTDENGKLVERAYFDPFGRRLLADGKEDTNGAVTPIGFTQHRHDDELGLIDMGGRIYDPKRRRFTVPDDIIPAPLFGQSYNRYSYLFQNPLGYTDPTGHGPDSTEGVEETVIGVVSVAVGWVVGLFSSGDEGDGKQTASKSNGSSPRPPPPPPPPAVQTNLQNYTGGVNTPGGAGRSGFNAPATGAAQAQPTCSGSVTMGCSHPPETTDGNLELAQDGFSVVAGVAGVIGIGAAGAGAYVLAAAGEWAAAGTALGPIMTFLTLPGRFEKGKDFIDRTFGSADDGVISRKQVDDPGALSVPGGGGGGLPGKGGKGSKGGPVTTNGGKFPKSVHGGKGYKTYGDFLDAKGRAGDNRQWHHVVEQNQEGKFGGESIHNTKNLVNIPTRVHQDINAWYGSKQDFTGGKTVREWVHGMSYDAQHVYGMAVLAMMTGKK
jgi:RHS repeat-associated protein